MDNEKHVFEPKHVDYELSPYTGLTRESWIEAAEYLLGGIFRNIKDFEDPVVMPRKEKNKNKSFMLFTTAVF